MEYLISLYIIFLIIDIYNLSIAYVAKIICDYNYYHCDESMNHKDYLPYVMAPYSGIIMIIRQLLLIITIGVIAVYFNFGVALTFLGIYIFYRFILGWLLFTFRFVRFKKYIIKILIINQEKWLDFFSNPESILENRKQSTKLGIPPYSPETANTIFKGIKNFEEKAYK